LAFLYSHFALVRLGACHEQILVSIKRVSGGGDFLGCN
jgi:hypothetical protein